MITEDYVSFETAKLLKEKGFDDCANSFLENGNMFPTCIVRRKEHYPAPTLQMAMKWLREVHERIILVNFHRKDRFSYDVLLDGECGDNYILYTEMSEHFKTYEEATEAAIKYCLENLM